MMFAKQLALVACSLGAAAGFSAGGARILPGGARTGVRSLTCAAAPQRGADRRAMLEGAAAAGIAALLAPEAASAEYAAKRSVPLGGRERGRGPEGVNKPELLPEGPVVNVIDLEKMLTKGQANKMNKLLAKLEADTQVKFRVLMQQYPETPGLAIKDYWGVDDNTIVMIVDRGNSKSGQSNILNFNVGKGVELNLPPIFWTRLRNFFGTSFYIKDNGEDVAIINAVDTVVGCLREGFCTDVPQEMKDMKNGNF